MSKKTMRRIRGVMFKMPLMITCAEFESFILGYLEDELAPRQKFVFDLHLKLCAECRDYLAAYRTSLELAKLGVKGAEDLVPTEVPEDLIRAVIDAREA